MVIATYIRTTGQGANWYEAPVSQMTSDLLEYFQGRASREPDYTKITEDTVSWCTSFEWADQLSLSTYTSKSGKLCLKCDPILSVEQRREQAQKLKDKHPTKKVNAISIEIDPDDLEM